MSQHKRTIQEKREDAADVHIVEEAIEELNTSNNDLDMNTRDNVRNYYEYVDKEPRL